MTTPDTILHLPLAQDSGPAWSVQLCKAARGSEPVKFNFHLSPPDRVFSGLWDLA